MSILFIITQYTTFIVLTAVVAKVAPQNNQYQPKKCATDLLSVCARAKVCTCIGQDLWCCWGLMKEVFISQMGSATDNEDWCVQEVGRVFRGGPACRSESKEEDLRDREGGKRKLKAKESWALYLWDPRFFNVINWASLRILWVME